MFAALRRWMFAGELDDDEAGCADFFVTRDGAFEGTKERRAQQGSSLTSVPRLLADGTEDGDGEDLDAGSFWQSAAPAIFVAKFNVVK